MKYSVEFCGGTHVESLGVSTAFVVSKEEAISKGVRRIYGLTGLRAEQAIRDLGLEVLSPRSRVEGEGQSIYFYDDDNHLLELHSGTLEQRLDRYAQGR